jgi:hypothetical protein
MTPSLILALIWALSANVLAMIPSNDNHWFRAYVLIAVGLPILGYVFWENGFWIGVIILAAALSVLRWPLRYLASWLQRKIHQR